MVDDEGRYEAPAWNGVYHVALRCVSNPALADTAEVRVSGEAICIDHEEIEYEYMLTFEGEDILDGQLYMPRGIDWRTNMVWIADTHHNVLRKYTENGEYLGATGAWTHVYLDEYNAPHYETRIGWLSRAEGEALQPLGGGIGWGVLCDDPAPSTAPTTWSSTRWATSTWSTPTRTASRSWVPTATSSACGGAGRRAGPVL